MAMTEKEMEELAAEIDEVHLRIGSVLNNIPVRPLAKVMALAVMAAHETLHDGEDEASFLNVSRAAWRKAIKNHTRCSGHGH